MKKLGYEELDLIKRFSRGELIGEELTQFNKRKKEDKGFARDVELHSALKTAFQHKDKEDLRALLNQENKAKRLTPVYLMRITAAAVVILIGGYFLFTQLLFSNKVTYAERNAQLDLLNLEYPPRLGGGATKTYEDYLADEEYELAFQALTSLCSDKDCNPIESYNLGRLQLYYKKNYKEAIEYFTRIVNDDVALDKHQDARLYLARAYFALGDSKSAKEYLNAEMTLKTLKEELK